MSVHEEKVKADIAEALALGVCKICDRKLGGAAGECFRIHALDAYNRTVYGTDSWGRGEETNAAFRSWNLAERECHARRVDWRERALAWKERAEDIAKRWRNTMNSIGIALGQTPCSFDGEEPIVDDQTNLRAIAELKERAEAALRAAKEVG